MTAGPGQPSGTVVRLDKWLWAARCFKTRSKAKAACAAGACRVNDAVAKASQSVRPGMRIEVQTPGGLRVLEVVGLADRRGSATAAQELFVDHSPPPPPRPSQADLLTAGPAFHRPRGAGRPTKRDRRRLQRELGVLDDD